MDSYIIRNKLIDPNYSEDWDNWNCWNECNNEPPIETTVTLTVNRPSDGLFCDFQQKYEGAVDYYEAKGVNHNEETNTTHGNTEDGSDVMRSTFNLIWNRPDGDFFRTL